MNEALHLLCLDRYHLDDVLFVQALARSLAGAGQAAPPCVIVHGSGERAERMLEGQGIFLERKNGVLQGTSPGEVALLERALRETSQKLVAALTDAMVYAVGVQGADRSLLRMMPDGETGGRLAVGKTGWIRELAAKRALPAIAATVLDPERGHLQEVSTAEAVVALGQAFGAEGSVEVVFFTKTNRPGLLREKAVLSEIAVEELPGESVLPEPLSLQHVAKTGLPVRITSVGAFLTGEGTRVVL
ncbi:MAG: acetylglutamate kinase [Rhodothermales bacterium]